MFRVFSLDEYVRVPRTIGGVEGSSEKKILQLFKKKVVDFFFNFHVNFSESSRIVSGNDCQRI